MTDALPTINITEHDYKNLTALIDSLPLNQFKLVQGLAEEIERAEIVPTETLNLDFVTIFSKVSYKNLDTGVIRNIELTFPDSADLAQDKISILSPVGTALLGLKVGQTISWPVPNGRVHRIRIKKIVQPTEQQSFDVLKTGT